MNFAEISKMIAESNDIVFLKEMGQKLADTIKQKVKEKKAEERRTGRPRGRPFIFNDKMQIVNALSMINDETAEKKPSQRHIQQLAEKGYLEPYASLSGAKGRPVKAYRLSKMGKKLLTVETKKMQKQSAKVAETA